MSYRVLQQRIYLKFYVKLGNNASDTCAMLSEAYEGEAMKMSDVSPGINGSNRARMSKS
jgi:hypothetical protein